MTDAMLTITGLTAIAHSVGVTDAQARALMEYAGVKVQPEPKPLPTEPGSVITATEVRGVKGEWQMILRDDGDWLSAKSIGGYYWHYPEDITDWTEARVVPVTAAPVKLTEDQVGEQWGKESAPQLAWSVLGSRNRERVTATVNAFLAQYAAPAEGEPIDLGDVREGDRVRLVLVNGDEVTFTVEGVWSDSIDSPLYSFHPNNIRAVYLLHREEA